MATRRHRIANLLNGRQQAALWTLWEDKRELVVLKRDTFQYFDTLYSRYSFGRSEMVINKLYRLGTYPNCEDCSSISASAFFRLWSNDTSASSLFWKVNIWSTRLWLLTFSSIISFLLFNFSSMPSNACCRLSRIPYLNAFRKDRRTQTKTLPISPIVRESKASW